MNVHWARSGTTLSSTSCLNVLCCHQPFADLWTPAIDCKIVDRPTVMSPISFWRARVGGTGCCHTGTHGYGCGHTNANVGKCLPMLNIKHTQLSYWLCLQFCWSKWTKVEMQTRCEGFFAPLLTWNGTEHEARLTSYLGSSVEFECSITCFLNSSWSLSLFCFICFAILFSFVHRHTSDTTAQWHVLPCITPWANLTFNGFILKPWFNGKLKILFRTRDSAFKSGELQDYMQAWRSLRRGINEAKRSSKQRIEQHFNSNDSRSMWQGIKTLTGYKYSYTATNSTDRTLPDSLNHVFSPLDNRIAADTRPALPVKDNAIQVDQHEVRSTLRSVNARKAAGPDGVTGRILKAWADQLAEVITAILNLSLPQSAVPHLPEVSNHHSSPRERHSELP